MVEEIGSVSERLVLPSPPTTCSEKCLGVLKVVVVMFITRSGGDGRGNDRSGLE
jgi:hypothetical protein